MKDQDIICNAIRFCEQLVIKVDFGMYGASNDPEDAKRQHQMLLTELDISEEDYKRFVRVVDHRPSFYMKEYLYTPSYIEQLKERVK